MMLQSLPLQLAKAFLGDDGESKQPGLNVPILAGNIQTPYLHSVAKVYAVLPFYDVKCLCSGGRE